MATRCNLKVSDDRFKFYLYRHWDGYPAETGADVISIVRLIESFTYIGYESPAIHAVNHLMKLGHYELTEQVHGDIAHFYGIQFTEGNKATIWYAGGYGSTLKEDAVTYPLKAFTGLVNREREQINKKRAELREESPEFYKDVTDYAIL